MAKKPKAKTLDQIKRDIDRAEAEKQDVENTYREIARDSTPKSLVTWRDFLVLLVVLLLFALAILERSRVLAFVAGLALIIVIIKIMYGYWQK